MYVQACIYIFPLSGVVLLWNRQPWNSGAEEQDECTTAYDSDIPTITKPSTMISLKKEIMDGSTNDCHHDNKWINILGFHAHYVMFWPECQYSLITIIPLLKNFCHYDILSYDGRFDDFWADVLGLKISWNNSIPLETLDIVPHHQSIRTIGF